MELSISQTPRPRFSSASPRFSAASHHHHRTSVHLTGKLLIRSKDAAFTSLSSSCMRLKLVSTNYRKISIRVGAAGSDPVLDRISRFQNACWRFLRPHTIRGTALGSTGENSSSLEGERGVLVVVVAQLLRGNEVIIKIAALAERVEFSLTHALFSLGMLFAGSLSCQTYCNGDLLVLPFLMRARALVWQEGGRRFLF
ncbi:hypothetical protein F2Q68_00002854 [Brassica cretica]|uniref:Uncharacterized protein n=1 Tax=Brassica cretica TaxID=69181 RepID=A0A8S9JE24_BRACR|nr:hypothetical protein F2Q68_00002854 [Brassica cretica]